MGNLDLAIAIIFYEKVEQTIECINSFLPSGVRIYVLNNNSSPLSRQQVGAFCINHPQVQIIDSDKNLGVANGRNYLINQTKEKWLFFVDNDIKIKTNSWLANLTRQIEFFPDIEVHIPRLLYVHQNAFATYRPIRIVGDYVIFDSKADYNYSNIFPGGASIIHRKIFDRLGLYDKQMFVGVEDYEFAIRGIRLGEPVKSKHIQSIVLFHEHRKTKNEEDRKSVLVRYNTNHTMHSVERFTQIHNLIFDANWELSDKLNIKQLTETASISQRTKFTQGLLQDLQKIWMNFQNKSLNIATIAIPPQVRKILRNKMRLHSRSNPYTCKFLCNSESSSVTIGAQSSQSNYEQDIDLKAIYQLLLKYPSLKTFKLINQTNNLKPKYMSFIIKYLKLRNIYTGVQLSANNAGSFLDLEDAPNYIELHLPDIETEIEHPFKELKARFGNVGLSYELNRENFRSVSKIVSLSDLLHPAFLHLSNYLTRDASKVEAQKVITTKDKNAIQLINAECAGREYVRVKPIYIKPENHCFNCRSYQFLLSADNSGDIGGCEYHVPPNASYGNVFRDRDPFNSLTMWRLREMLPMGQLPHKDCLICYANWR